MKQSNRRSKLFLIYSTTGYLTKDNRCNTLLLVVVVVVVVVVVFLLLMLLQLRDNEGETLLFLLYHH